MRKETKLFIIGFILSCSLIYHNRVCGQVSLSYDDFGVFFRPEKSVDTLEFTLTKYYPGYKLKLFLKDFGGACYIELYSKKQRLKMTGHFVNGPDTLLKYSFSKQLGPPLDKKYYGVQLLKYLCPLKKGVWTYYDDKGNLITKSEYDYNFN